MGHHDVQIRNLRRTVDELLRHRAEKEKRTKVQCGERTIEQKAGEEKNDLNESAPDNGSGSQTEFDGLKCPDCGHAMLTRNYKRHRTSREHGDKEDALKPGIPCQMPKSG